jgi:hypothetical protein
MTFVVLVAAPSAIPMARADGYFKQTKLAAVVALQLEAATILETPPICRPAGLRYKQRSWMLPGLTTWTSNSAKSRSRCEIRKTFPV